MSSSISTVSPKQSSDKPLSGACKGAIAAALITLFYKSCVPAATILLLGRSSFAWAIVPSLAFLLALFLTGFFAVHYEKFWGAPFLAGITTGSISTVSFLGEFSANELSIALAVILLGCLTLSSSEIDRRFFAILFTSFFIGVEGHLVLPSFGDIRFPQRPLAFVWALPALVHFWTLKQLIRNRAQAILGPAFLLVLAVALTLIAEERAANRLLPIGFFLIPYVPGSLSKESWKTVLRGAFGRA